LPDTLQALVDRKVLVTGATGFLGRHLTRALTKAGVRPVLMLRPGADAPKGFSVVRATLDDPDTLRSAVTKAEPDVIFHLAAQTNPARDTSLTWSMLARNLYATVALAEAASVVGVDRFVFAGTCEEYGQQTPPFSETLPAAPVSPYSASKAAATLWLKMLNETHGFPAVILRPFLVYGPGQAPPKLIPSACLAALEDRDFDMTTGQQHRELTYVGDVVGGMIDAAVTPRAVGQILNLGAGTEHRVIDLVRKIYALAGGNGRPRPGTLRDRPNDMQHFCADTSRAYDILGWKAETSLDDGLEKTLAWMRDHGDTPVPL
jgi:nucleoside-diphosphate-sugar epimerase